MSVISDRHQFSQLTKFSKPLDGQRLVRLIAKGENKSPNLSESMCVSIPQVTQDQVADAIDRLLPHVVGLVQGAQDKIIREYRITSGHDGVGDNAIGMEEVIQWLDANAAGDRVSAEYLTEWFKEEYWDAATQYVASALGLDVVNGEVPMVVIQKCNVLRDMFTGWASPKYSPAIPKLRAMIRFAGSVSEVDGRMSGLVTKCNVMLEKKLAEMTDDALGF